MIKELIGSILAAIAYSSKLSREAFGHTVVEIGENIRAGKIIADKAFMIAQDDQESLEKAYYVRE